MWRKALTALLTGTALVAAPVAAAPAATQTQRAAAYLERAQNGDGGFGFSPGDRTSPIATHWAAMGLGAAGRKPSRIHQLGGDTLAAAVARTAGQELDDASTTARAILALRASGGTSTLVARLARMQQGDGSFDGLVTTTAFGVFALRSSGRSSRDSAVRHATAFLAAQQNTDGGFSAAGRGAPSGIDETAAGLQALWRGGYARTSSRVRRAARFLRGQQGADGGFPLRKGAPANAQSTAWAVQGFVAAGIPLRRVRRAGSRDPLTYLRSLQSSDGSVRYSRTSDQTPIWVTAQALMALARKPF